MWKKIDDNVTWDKLGFEIAYSWKRGCYQNNGLASGSVEGPLADAKMDGSFQEEPR
jgi:hypothetical protein